MSRLLLLAPAFALALLCSQSCLASPITYTISASAGGGTVTGTIETDGTIGTLADSDFLDWDLTLNDGNGTATLLGPLSGNNSGVGTDGGVTATATLLEFNASGPDYFNIHSTGIFCSPPQWGFVGAAATGMVTSLCDGTTVGQEGIAAVDFFPTLAYSAESGEVVLGTAAAAVPEPSFGVIVLVAFLGIKLIQVRERTRAAASR